MQKRIVPVLLAAALLISGFLSIMSIHRLQGNARIINYTGVVRGATQRLVKQELNGIPNDALIAQVEAILYGLSAGDKESGLSRLDDDAYQTLISEMQTQWTDLKEEIFRVRQGMDGTILFQKSEAYFDLADRAVCAAEVYSEQQIVHAEKALFALSAVFLILAAVLAWYGALQARRQQALQEAEEKNRAESEQLAHMSEDLRAPMNELSELIYISDPETNELLFVNEAGRKTFHLTNFRGQKCYRALQGLDKPCEFCTNPILVPGENYTWEHTNPLSNRHYLLKDRLIRWEGRLARLEIAFDITESEAEKQQLKNTLDAELMIMECVRTLYKRQDFAVSFPAVLERLGNYLCADRIYLAMIRENKLYNDFEWREGNCGPKAEFLQDLSPALLQKWQADFEQEGCIIFEQITNIEELHPKEYEVLHTRNIRTLAAAGLEQDGRLRGMLVVDNPPPERIRGISSLLQTLCYFLILTYQRMEDEQLLSHLSYYDTLTSFYNRNRYIEDIAALSRFQGTVGIVFLDVNGLKELNDQRGHAFGDRVLIQCAHKMRECFKEADYYRIGGDEFVIICLDIDEASFLKNVDAVRGSFASDEFCHAAIGAQWASLPGDVEAIIAEADAKMYDDKKEFYRQNPATNRYRHD